jgi:hypothetical protein
MTSLSLAATTLVEQQTRFLYPFFFKRRSVPAACGLLRAATEGGHEGLQIWEAANPHHFYQEEMLDPVIAFLFSHPETAGCGYLRLAGAVGNRWFTALHARFSDGNQMRVRLSPLAGVEVFLSNHGSGVLSLALRPQVETLDDRQAIEFNYRISQLRPHSAATLCRPHPREDPNTWAHLSAEQKAHIRPPPDTEASIEERLGRPGGCFLLHEVIGMLLSPLAHDLELRPAQTQLSVYTALRFTHEVDLDDPQAVSALAPVLSALAQIEEPAHAGARAGEIGVPEAILNRRHWASVGRQSAVHLVADQAPPSLPFNEARLPRVMMKYFIPYLMALLQRTALQRIIDEACTVVLSPDKDTAQGVADLRQDLLEFAVNGHFTEVSSRAVVHRYYRIAQEGLGVRDVLTDARRSIADIDARHSTARQIALEESVEENTRATRRLQARMNRQITIVAHVQVMVEWIEIFLVSVYAAHLWEMIAGHVPALHDWIWQGVIVAALLGGGITAVILRPWRHRVPHRSGRKRDNTGGAATSRGA